MNYIMYNNKPHRIKDIEDQGPEKGNVYHLEGGIKVHQNKLDSKKNPLMWDHEVAAWHAANGKSGGRVETDAEGHVDIQPGKEPLKKNPLKKSLRERWDLIKRAISHEDAFMDINQSEQPTEEDEQPQQDAQDAPEDQDSGDDQGQQEAPEDDQDSQASDDSGTDSEESDVQPEDAESDDSGEQQDDQGELESQLADQLRREGYSDTEIAYIIHGHSVPGPDVDSARYDNEVASGKMDQELQQHTNEQEKQRQALLTQAKQAELESKRAKHEAEKDDHAHLVEHNKKKRELDLEIERRKRELELKYMEEKLKIELDNMKEDAKHKRQLAKDKATKIMKSLEVE